jgi:hypothetical protein
MTETIARSLHPFAYIAADWAKGLRIYDRRP